HASFLHPPLHVLLPSLLEVQLPFRRVRVRFPAHLDVTPYPHLRGFEQEHRLRFAPFLPRCFPEQHPVVSPDPGEVFPPHPVGSFFRVPSSRPTPHAAEDDTIYLLVSAFTRRMPVVRGPTPYPSVQIPDQFPGRRVTACLLDTLS